MIPTAKGVRTSEGQLTIVAVIGAVVAALAQLPTAVQALAIVSAAAVAIAYIVSRTRVKTSALDRATTETVVADQHDASRSSTKRVAAGSATRSKGPSD